MSEYTGMQTGQGKRLALVASRFNGAITRQLWTGATDELYRLGVAEDTIDTFWVPGAFDLPPAARRVADSGRYDAVICLGAVIRGATPHFDYVAAEAAKGIAGVAQSSACPVVFGVLTCDNEAQAWERAGGKSGNKGADSARMALELLDLYGQIG
jgi:6,7-dimethyl-8-ribityllumazine synthase